MEEHVARKWHKTQFAWQRGRIERHGGIVKEMLSRIDNEKPTEDLNQFDEALRESFHAKNTVSVVDGYNPEQAVLGKAAKLPASIVDDEDLYTLPAMEQTWRRTVSDVAWS